MIIIINIIILSIFCLIFKALFCKKNGNSKKNSVDNNKFSSNVCLIAFLQRFVKIALNSYTMFLFGYIP